MRTLGQNTSEEGLQGAGTGDGRLGKGKEVNKRLNPWITEEESNAGTGQRCGETENHFPTHRVGLR